MVIINKLRAYKIGPCNKGFTTKKSSFSSGNSLMYGSFLIPAKRNLSFKKIHPNKMHTCMRLKKKKRKEGHTRVGQLVLSCRLSAKDQGLK